MGKQVTPIDDFQVGQRSLNLVGYEGLSLIAVSGLDMAIWDALAKAAGLPLTRLLGGTVGPVPAYNSNGLWLTEVSTLAAEAAQLWAEGGFTALKLRLGRDALAADLTAISEVRQGAGTPSNSWSTSTRGFRWAMRCIAVTRSTTRLYWLEEPIAYDNIAGYAQLTRELKTPVQLGENFYGPRELYKRSRRRRRLHDARSDADWRRQRLAAVGPDCRRGGHPEFRRICIRNFRRI